MVNTTSWCFPSLCNLRALCFCFLLSLDRASSPAAGAHPSNNKVKRGDTSNASRPRTKLMKLEKRGQGEQKSQKKTNSGAEGPPMAWGGARGAGVEFAFGYFFFSPFGSCSGSRSDIKTVRYKLQAKQNMSLSPSLHLSPSLSLSLLPCLPVYLSSSLSLSLSFR